MTQIGTGKYTYELIPDFFKLPEGQSFGLVSRVAADAQDRIYVFQRKDPPVVVFDRDGKYLGAWGSGEVTDPHGLKIVGDVVYYSNLASKTTDGLNVRTGKLVFSYPDGAFNPVIADDSAIYLTGYTVLYQMLPQRPRPKPRRHPPARKHK